MSTSLRTNLSSSKSKSTRKEKLRKEALQAKLAAVKFNVAQLEDEVNFLAQSEVKHKALLEKGLISGSVYHVEEQTLAQKKIELEEKRSELNEILSETKKEYRPEELRNKEQQLLTEIEQRDVLQVSLNQTEVVNPHDGRILEVMVNMGDAVKPSTPLVWMEKKPIEKEGEGPLIYSYFSIESGKRISLDTQVEITVPEVNHNKYGNILGKVIESVTVCGFKR